MRADRLLSIVLLLQTHRHLTSRTLAERLEVSERTIHRDMEALSGAGIPVVAERGSGGGWSLMGEYRTDLTGLNESEIQSLFMTQSPKVLADLKLTKASEAALLKLTRNPLCLFFGFLQTVVHILDDANNVHRDLESVLGQHLKQFPENRFKLLCFCRGLFKRIDNFSRYRMILRHNLCTHIPVARTLRTQS